jgi:hypothetical protein
MMDQPTVEKQDAALGTASRLWDVIIAENCDILHALRALAVVSGLMLAHLPVELRKRTVGEIGQWADAACASADIELALLHGAEVAGHD